MFNTERLRSIRKAYGISQAELGRQLNLSNNSISKYELGTSEPNLDTLVKLARIFHVSTDYLLGITDEPDNISHHESGQPVRRALSSNEELLLKLFNDCSEDCQEYLISKARILSIEGLMNHSGIEEKGIIRNKKT